MSTGEKAFETGPTGDLERQSPSPSVSIKENGFGLRPEVFKTTFHEVAFIFTSLFTVGMISLLVGGLIITNVKIGKALEMTDVQITWLSAGSMLSSGAFLMLFGRIADLYGTRNQLIISLLLFSAFNVGCGFANSGVLLVVLSTISGIFTSSGIPAAQSILSRAYGQLPSRRKNTAFGFFTSGFPVCFTLGLVSSGVADKITGWRGFFFFLAIFYFSVAVLAYFVTPNMPIEAQATEHLRNKDTTGGQSIFQRLHRLSIRLDLVGVLLTISGFVLFSIPFTLVEHEARGWATPHVLVMLIVGIILIGIFVMWERYCQFPLINMSIWLDRNFSILMGVTALNLLAIPAGEFWTAFYFQQVLHDSTLISAAKFIPMTVAGFVSSACTGAILHRASNKLLSVCATICLSGGFLVISFFRDGDAYFPLIPIGLVLMVIGVNSSYGITNMYMMTSMPPAAQAVAGGLMGTLVRLVASMSLALTSCIFNVAKRNLPKVNPETDFYRAGPYRPYAAVFWFCTGLTAISVVLTLFLTISTQGGADLKKSKRKADGAAEKAGESAEWTAEAPDDEKIKEKAEM